MQLGCNLDATNMQLECNRCKLDGGNGVDEDIDDTGRDGGMGDRIRNVFIYFSHLVKLINHYK